MRHGKILSIYTLGAIIPYFLFAWLLLSVVLFVQQGSRFSDLIFNTALPDILVWQLMIALVPNVVAFTGPIALLVGVVIGLSRMQGDSEMTAIRAAGVGNAQILLPVAVLGVLLSLFAFSVNLLGVPFASQIVRRVALQAALFKLQSPVDPGIFNTEINGLTIFVKDGDIESGKWKSIFILQKDPNKTEMRLITAREGFVGTRGEDSEIVLEDARIASLNAENTGKFAFERVGRIRLSVQTKRGELIERLAKSKETPEEMGLYELWSFSRSVEGIERTEALLLFQRRILLSVTPLIFALLGAALVGKFNRGGKGLGIVLALVCLVFYYLVTLFCEQLARTGTISVLTAGVIPLVMSLALILWLLYSKKVNLPSMQFIGKLLDWRSVLPRNREVKRVPVFSRWILDTDIVKTVLRNYSLTLSFLIAMYVLFTAFELWKFAGTIENGPFLLVQYLIFLIPFIYIQIAPSALMVGSLAAFVIKTRQNEVVTWASAGRSVYRILLPCFALAVLIGIFNFGVQETLLSPSNRVQDELRDRIRSRNQIVNEKTGVWITSARSIISFDKKNASDNANEVENLRVFRFRNGSSDIESMLTAGTAEWDGTKAFLPNGGELIQWSGDGDVRMLKAGNQFDANLDPFQKTITKPSHLTAAETRLKIRNATADNERQSYSVSLQKKYSTLLLPFVIVLFTAPFALRIHSKGNVATIAYAAGLWLVYMGFTTVLGQFGQSGQLDAVTAVWSPLIVFSLIGLFLLSRVRT